MVELELVVLVALDSLFAHYLVLVALGVPMPEHSLHLKLALTVFLQVRQWAALYYCRVMMHLMVLLML